MSAKTSDPKKRVQDFIQKALLLERSTIQIFLGTVLVLGILASSGYASTANPLPPFPDNETPYMALNHDMNEKTVFGWNEIPYAYFLLPDIDASRTFRLSTVWKYGGEVIATQSETFAHIYSLGSWKGLDNWTDAGVRQAGLWTIDSHWGYVGSKYSMCTTQQFTVTPEPFGAALFLIGGLALLAKKRMPNRRLAK